MEVQPKYEKVILNEDQYMDEVRERDLELGDRDQRQVEGL